MIDIQISNNPNINGKRFLKVNVTLNLQEIVLSCNSYYLTENNEPIIDVISKSYVFSCINDYVNPNTGQTVEQDETGNYPSGSIKEIDFLKNLPANLFNSDTLWGKIEQLVTNKIQVLDSREKFK